MKKMKKYYPVILSSIIYFSVVITVQAANATSVTRGNAYSSVKTNVNVNDVNVTVDGEEVSVTSDSGVSVEVEADGDGSSQSWRKRVVVSKPDVSSLLKKYEVARSEYRDQVQLYKAGRRDFLSARRQYLKLMDTESETALIEASKTWLSQGIEVLLSHLGALEARISSSEKISEENKASLLTEIGEAKAYLQGQLEAVEAATTLDELRAISKDIRQYWLDLRPRLKIWLGRWSGYRIERTLGRLEAVLARLEEKTDSYEEQGCDVSQARDLLAQAQSALQDARDEYEALQDKYRLATTMADIDVVLREANTAARKLAARLTAIHRQARGILAELRKCPHSITSPDEISGEPDDIATSGGTRTELAPSEVNPEP